MNSTEQDMLLSDLLDGETIEREWAQWSAAAETDPALWRRLAEAQRDELALVRSLNRASSIADAVEVSSQSDVEIITTSTEFGARRSVWSWTGWAMAATLMLVAAVWKLQIPPANNTNTSQPIVNTAGIASAPEDYFKQYLETGKRDGTVIGELPARIVLEARPAENGIGYDVTFLRQIQERTRVPDLYQVVGEDDRGRAQLVSYEPPAGNPM